MLGYGLSRNWFLTYVQLSNKQGKKLLPDFFEVRINFKGEYINYPLNQS